MTTTPHGQVPEAFLKSVIALCSHRGYSPANIEAWDKDDKWIADLWRQAEAMLAASPTPPAEQQAAPKAAPGEPSDYQIRAITTAYEQGVGKGHQAYISGKETANPYDSTYRCDLAWQYGYREGKEQAQRGVKAAPGGREQAAPQPAPAPLSEPIDQLERNLAIIGVVGVVDGHDVVRRESVLEIARRAAIAAQGGKDA